MEIYSKNSPELHVARPIAMQHATFKNISATGNATQVQLIDLKALSRLVLERNRQCNSSATHTQKQCNFEAKNCTESCSPSCTIFEAEKHTEHQIRIERMTICLHGKTCNFLFLADDRQICSKNNQPIFGMTVCPDGKWERGQDKQKPQKKTRTCYCCGSQTFWRKKGNRGGRWICEVCHPPVLSKDEIEWLQ